MTIASCESGDFMRANGEYEQNTSESNQTQVHPDVVAYVASHMQDQDDLIDVAYPPHSSKNTESRSCEHGSYLYL